MQLYANDQGPTRGPGCKHDGDEAQYRDCLRVERAARSQLAICSNLCDTDSRTTVTQQT
jgi:hypothetical protein